MDGDALQDALTAYGARQRAYEDLARRLELLLHDICVGAEVDPAVIEARSKPMASLEKKLGRPDYSSLNEITDLCGARVIVFQLSDVEPVAKVIRSEFEVIEEQMHGVEKADAFGYRSLHLLVTPREPRVLLTEWKALNGLIAEIQVRTVLQHAWAAISHKLDYKSETGVPQPSRRKLFRVSALLETGDELFDQFRSEVEALRESYSSESETDRWRDLELNRDSLLAVQERIDWDAVTDWVIAEAGFDDPRPRWGDSPRVHNPALERAASIAQEAGLQTTGDIADYIADDMRALAPRLKRVREMVEAEDDVIWAVGPDVVSFALMLEHPTHESYGFASSILRAIAEEGGTKRG